MKEQQTKKQITRAWIERELRFYNWADIRSCLVLVAALSLFFLPLVALCVWGIVSVALLLWLKLVLAVVVGVALSAPVWGNLLSLRKHLIERKQLLHGEIEIVSRTVLYKSERAWRGGVYKLLHFPGFPPIAVSDTEYWLCDSGDEFYLVHYRGSEEIKLYYAARTHEYKI